MSDPWGKPQQMRHFYEEKCLILQNNSCSFSALSKAVTVALDPTISPLPVVI